jgi:aspartokinase
VHKFGGTCVASAQRISDIADYLLATDPAGHKLVVVSAMGAHPDSPLKVTDLLINMVAKASRQDEAFLLDLAALQVRAGVRGVGRGWRALCLLARPGGAAGAPQLPSARAWV